MGDGIVLVSFIALLVVTALLFASGTWLRTSHWLFSLVLAGTVGAASWGLAERVADTGLEIGHVILAGVVLTALIAAALDDWTSLGHIAMAFTVAASAGFLIYAVVLLATIPMGPWSLAFGVVLLLLQACAHLLVWTHTFEILDVICRRRWRRRAGPMPGYMTPKVSIHVPTHNEPPELVTLTLDALAALDYPDFEVLVIDNNTADEAVWRPVEAHCRLLGPRFRFFHLMPWPGYKSGALNFALTETAADAEVVAVVDADYIVRPDFLRALIGHFADERIAFVQTPQDYRDVEDRGRYGRALYLAYRVFFDLSMPSRNERNAIIYAGTMGLVRRSVLEQVGGWDEWCITEDAELSVRLLAAGHESLFVAESFGHGLMPLDFAGLKKQRFRWAFGGMQILRRHASRLFAPWRTDLTVAQRLAYIVGGIQWLNDPLTVAFTLLLLIGGGALALGGSIFVQPLAGAALFVPTLFVLVSILRFLWAFRHAARCRFREAVDALSVLLALTWVVTLACLLGLVKRRGVFLRTPKSAGRITVGAVVRIAFAEALLGVLCVLTLVALLVQDPSDLLSARGLMLVLLLWQAFVYLSALRTSVWSYQAHPERQPLALWRDYHTAGPRTGPFVPEWRTAIVVAGLGALLATVFYIALSSAPGVEVAMRADPYRQQPLTRSLMGSLPEASAGGLLLREAAAVQRGDLDAVLALWASDGVVEDHNFTPHDASDDRRWEGLPEVRARYAEELATRQYRRLRHRNLRIEVAGDEAVIHNDLEAMIQSAHGTYQVHLVNSDRWTLRRVDGGWRVKRLDLNRSSAPAPRQIAAGWP